MIKLAIAICQIPNSNSFKLYAIQVFNKRYIEFQHPIVIYFIKSYTYCPGKLLDVTSYVKPVWSYVCHVSDVTSFEGTSLSKVCTSNFNKADYFKIITQVFL